LRLADFLGSASNENRGAKPQRKPHLRPISSGADDSEGHALGKENPGTGSQIEALC